MPAACSLSEALRLAEALERNGSKFYRRAAEVTRDATVKEIFLDLAAQEDEHEKFFADLRRRLCAAADPEWWDPTGEAAGYLRALAENHVFNLDQNVADLVTSIQSVPSALRLAIGFEKDTIVFFSGLQAAVHPDNRDKVELLIKEEFRHIRRLNDALIAT